MASLLLLNNFIMMFCKPWKVRKSNCPSLRYFSLWDVCQSLWGAWCGEWMTCLTLLVLITNAMFTQDMNNQWALVVESRSVRMPGGRVLLAFERIWHGHADLWRTKSKSDDLATLSYSDEPTHFSEVVGILPPPPPPLCLTSNNPFSGDGAFGIYEYQVAHEWTKSVRFSGTSAVLHEMAGSAVLNVEGHDLCHNFCFLIKNPLLHSLKLCSCSSFPLLVCKDPRDGHQDSEFTLGLPACGALF